MKRWKRLFGFLLAGAVAFGMMPGPIAAAEGAPEIEPGITLEEGTYVPGEVLACYSKALAEASPLSTEVYGAAEDLLETGEDFMDISYAARDLAEQEEPELSARVFGAAHEPEENETVIRLIRSDRYTTEQLLAMVTDLPGVLFAEPNYVWTIPEDEWAAETVYGGVDETDIPDLTGYQYAYGNAPGGMDVPGWNDPGNTNAAGVVAILDSGVDYLHPDLKDVMWDMDEEDKDVREELTALGGGKYGYNAVDCDPDPMAENPHGTHCAGIVAGAWNGFGISGAANGAKIMAVRNIDKNGAAALDATVRGFAYIKKAKELGVDVVAVNCSFGGFAESKSYNMCMKEMEEAGIVVAYASGNDGWNIDTASDDGSLYYDMPGTITVNNQTKEGAGDVYSNYGIRSTHIYSPGEEILSTVPRDESKFRPDIKDSPAVTVSGNEAADRYDLGNTWFEREINTAAGVIEEEADGMLKLKNMDPARGNDDPITQETVGGYDLPDHLAVMTLTAPAPLPSLPEGKSYRIMLRAKTETKRVYFKVFAKTEEGNWDRPALTNILGDSFSGAVYTLGTGIYTGEPFDLDQLTLRLVVSLYDDPPIPVPEIDVEMLWVTDAEEYPYAVYSGTSMATPAVCGEAAILAKAFPDDSAGKRAARILAGAKFTEEYKTRCITGGMANVRNALNPASYTPVVNNIYQDEKKDLHIEGYFFGGKDQTEVILEQDGLIWRSGTDFTIKEVKNGDPEEILLTSPKWLSEGEIKVTVKNLAGPEERDSFTRILVMDPMELFHDISVPSEFADFAVFGMTAIQGNLILYGVRASADADATLICSLEGSEPRWTLIDGAYLSGIPWKGKLLRVAAEGAGTEVVSLYDLKKGSWSYGSLMLPEGASETADHFRFAAYYDGERTFLFATPMTGSGPLAPTEVWEFDPYLCGSTAKKLGALSGAYLDPGITHREIRDGGTVRRILYVTGQDELQETRPIQSERFFVREGGLETELLHTAPEIPFQNPAPDYSTIRYCGTRDGIFVAGAYTAAEDKPTGYAEITADNFYYSYGGERFEPGAFRLSPRQVYMAAACAYDGRIYIAGESAGKGESFFLSWMNADTLEPYGDWADETDPQVPVKKLTLNKTRLNLTSGDQEKLEATAVFSDPEETTDIVYESSNPVVVRVNAETGELIAENTGTASITARCGNRSAVCKVSVDRSDSPEGLNYSRLTLYEGEMDVLELGNYPSRGEDGYSDWYRTGKETLSFTSSNKNVVSVNKGLLTAKKVGTAVITATWKSGSRKQTYTCTVTVEPVPVPKAEALDKGVKLSVSPSSLKLNAGEEKDLTATLTGTDYGKRTVVMRTTNPDIIGFQDTEEDTIVLTPDPGKQQNQGTATGKLLAHDPGTAYVVVESFEGTEGSRTEETPLNRKIVKVTVSAPAEGIKIFADSELVGTHLNYDVTELTLTKGDVDAVYYRLSPEICTDAPKVKWSVKGSGISLKNGVITAKSVTKTNKKGESEPAVVTISCGKQKTKLKVYVTE